MVPMKKKDEKKGVKKKQMMTMEIKKKIIAKYEQGSRVTDIASFYKKSTSTICTILKNKEEIKSLDTAKGVMKMSKQRPRALEDVEKLLLVWINEMQRAGIILTESCIRKKAKDLYGELVIKMSAVLTEGDKGFKASNGWFDKFKRRSGISLIRHEDAVNLEAKLDDTAITEFVEPEEGADSRPTDSKEFIYSIDPIENSQLTVDATFQDENLSNFSVDLLENPKLVTIKTEPVEFKEHEETNTNDDLEEFRYISNTLSVMKNEENEFDCFGKSVACQLKKLPEGTALESMAYIQSYLVKQRLQFLKK